MALTGHLSDLSLSELIEFFCNQRKTGCLNVLYPQGHGSFFLQAGSVVDAQIGVLRGIDAVYYALTLPNASFEFKSSDEAPERTINQPWTQVVLEGLRRLDEGLIPADAFPDGPMLSESEQVVDDEAGKASSSASAVSAVPAFLADSSSNASNRRKPLIAAAVGVAILASVAVIGVPAGWYRESKPAAAATQPVATSAPVQSAPEPAPTNDVPATAEVDPRTAEAALAAKRLRDKERAKALAAAQNTTANPTTPVAPAASSGPRKVTVQVSYDESGRVVQASGADPTAVRIARQKHFPPGKAGTATVTIPIN